MTTDPQGTDPQGTGPEHPDSARDPGAAAPTTPLTPPPAPGDDPAPDATPPGASAAPAQAPAAATPERPGPRTSPIVWGALILAFCGYIAQRVYGAGDIDAAWWITATVIGLGVLLLGVGIAVLVRGRR